MNTIESTEEELRVRVRIAEWMGWRRTAVHESVYPWRTPSGGFCWEHEIPSFATSLDAIASAEARLTREQCNAYNTLLMEGKPPRSEMTCEAEKWSWHSSARTRAHALALLLLTINPKLP